MKSKLFCKRNGILFAVLLGAVLLSAVSCEQLMGDLSSDEGKGKGQEEPLPGSYILVRGDNSGSDVLRQVLRLKHAMDECFDTDVSSSTDWAVDVTADEGAAREILVGVTNRAESLAANEELKGIHGYVIRSSGEGIVITASTTGLLKEAVDRFVTDFVSASKDGRLPAEIDVFHRAELPLCVMSEPSSMRLFVSGKASPALLTAAEFFCSCIASQGGIVPEIVEDVNLEPSKIVVSLKNTVFTESASNPEGLPQAGAPTGFTLERSGDKITLSGKDELQTVAALAELYEILSEGADRTLDGKSVFFYSRKDTYKENWSRTVPRLVGGRYLGSESVAGNSWCSYYEEVPSDVYYAYKNLLAEALSLQNGAADSAVFVSADGSMEIAVYYDSSSRTLSVVEHLR